MVAESEPLLVWFEPTATPFSVTLMLLLPISGMSSAPLTVTSKFWLTLALWLSVTLISKSYVFSKPAF